MPLPIARRGGGSLVSSVFTADDDARRSSCSDSRRFTAGCWSSIATARKSPPGHGSPLPHLIHGGPGRAGGGEEMGGIRGVMHYMQRTADSGHARRPITAVTGRWAARRARRLTPERSPVPQFRSTSSRSATPSIPASAKSLSTISNVSRTLSGDHFYAHMDEEAARRNPFFGGRVAHGYFLISAAAGLFVDPPYGPVLANYGLDRLRFVKPVKPGDRIKVRLTCKEKSLRADKGYGEVRWDTEITNQNGESVASYDVLTMVSEQAVPGGPP